MSKLPAQPDFSRYTVDQFITKDYLLKDGSTPLKEIAKCLDVTSAVLTTKEGRVTGIITSSNVIDSAMKK
jgi:predicted transcriptional regulator